MLRSAWEQGSKHRGQSSQAIGWKADKTDSLRVPFQDQKRTGEIESSKDPAGNA